MKNLENFGVQELDATEMNSVEGGGWRWIVTAVKEMVKIVYDECGTDPACYNNLYNMGSGNYAMYRCAGGK